MSLLDHCTTDIEQMIIAQYEEDTSQSYSAIASSIDMHRTTVSRAIKRVTNRAALHGYSPEHDMVHVTPDTHVLKGTSTLYDEYGAIKQQWVKTNLKLDAQLEALQAAVEGLKEDIPASRPVPLQNRIYNADLLSLVTFSDHHLGMLAWSEEGGANWNLETAENMLVDCFSAMMDSSPNAETCIINNLGDFLHYDGLTPQTPTHRNPLDSDSRFPKIVRSAIRVIRQIVQMALERHRYVHIKMVEGNHDIASSVWLRELFEVLYEVDPRVTVDTSPKPYQTYKFGDVMLGFHHGHCRKSAQLPLLFASEFSYDWGHTKYRIAHVGHRHHQEIKEYSGMTVEQHSTLAAKDAHASRGGYGHNRRATCITYHRHFGEVARNYVSPEMLGYV